MLDSHDVIRLLELARDEEHRFTSRLTPAERAASGTLDEPAPKDVLAHIAGAKAAMSVALVAMHGGDAPDPSHDRGRLFHANCGRPFLEIEQDAGRHTKALLAEVERLTPDTLSTSPAWISERTLGEEIVMYGATHALTHLFGPLGDRGEIAEAVRAQQRYVAALPASAPDELHAGGLYNLGCLYARDGREDDTLEVIRQAIALESGLAELAQQDSDLARVKEKLREIVV